MGTLNVRIDDDLDTVLTRLAEQTHRTKSELVRDMLRREAARAELKRGNALLRPFAERAGYLTDEDFFSEFS